MKEVKCKVQAENMIKALNFNYRDIKITFFTLILFL